MRKINEKNTKMMHEKNFQKLGLDINVGAVSTALLIIVVIGILSFVFKDTLTDSVAKLSSQVLNIFSLPMLLIMFLSFILVFVFALSPVGNIRLGGSNAEPKFKKISWYAMLFGAGMGIGFMFWGVAEPLLHSQISPIFESTNSYSQALATTFFHWAFFPWALYAIISLALAYYAYNMNLPLAPRSLFYPMLKEKIYGLTGDIIDGIAVVLTLFALASSLGLGALQVNAGFSYLFDGIPMSSTIQVIIILLVTTAATISLVTGVDKGIRILSEANIYLAGVLVVCVLFLGPTLLIFKETFLGIVLYFKDVLFASFTLMSNSAAIESTYGSSWAGSWTLFYWAWWIGWAIFVGIFIAKISIGRTIREFVLSVTIIPSIIAFVWFGVFGTSAISVNGDVGNSLLNIVNENEALSLYALIEDFNLVGFFTLILFVISIILVISFFVTSSDSGSLVVDNLTSGGSPVNPLTQKIFWAFLEGFIAIFLLIFGGESSLNMIQNFLIIVAGPFSVILFLVYGMFIYQLTFDRRRLRIVKKNFV